MDNNYNSQKLYKRFQKEDLKQIKLTDRNYQLDQFFITFKNYKVFMIWLNKIKRKISTHQNMQKQMFMSLKVIRIFKNQELQGIKDIKNIKNLILQRWKDYLHKDQVQ